MKRNLKGIDDDKWTKEGIGESLKEFLDKSDDSEKISQAIIDFIQNARKHSNEGLTTYDDKFNPISNFIPGDSERYIDIPQNDINKITSYFGLVGHSHTKSKMPFPNWYDLETGILNQNIKYNMIYAPDFGVTLIKRNPEKSYTKKSLKSVYDEANRKRKNYVNNQTTKVKNKYKEQLKINDNLDIKIKADLKEIEDVVRHSDMNIQCEFYNKEFKQEGIEFIYIVP